MQSTTGGENVVAVAVQCLCDKWDRIENFATCQECKTPECWDCVEFYAGYCEVCKEEMDNREYGIV